MCRMVYRLSVNQLPMISREADNLANWFVVHRDIGAKTSPLAMVQPLLLDNFFICKVNEPDKKGNKEERLGLF